MMDGKKTVVLLSGGLDSSTLLYDVLRAEGDKNTISLSVHYGQRHWRELAAAYAISKRARVQHVTVDVPQTIWDGASSSQVGVKEDVPHGHYADESMKVTVIPNRNMLLLATAAAVALSRGALRLAYAAHAGDHAIYPDCRPAFIDAMRLAFKVCAYEPLELYTPFNFMTKADVVLKGHHLSVPLELTYSCYEGNERHCGRCGTCVERREAFQVAKVDDPTEYEV
jgi:7-cyano-7-deazaguanine synthase